MSATLGALLLTMTTAPIMVTGAPEGPSEDYQIGYDALMSGEDQVAIDEIEAGRSLAEDDPARLINYGIALARSGSVEAARGSFEAAARNRQRLELETSTGAWVDSKDLARRALAMLDRGELAHRYALLLR